MKYPVLHVRRNAGRDAPGLYPEAHGAPIEHPARETPEPEKRRRAPRRGSALQNELRGRLVFIVVLILAIAAFAILRYGQRQPQDHATLSGWQIALRATAVDGSLSAMVGFSPQGRQGEALTASVRFHLPESGAEALLTVPLDQRQPVARAVLPLVGGERQLQAEVRIDGASAVLAVRLPQP